MIPDPTAEIKRIRHQLGAEDEFDLNRIFARIQRLQAESGRECVRRPSRRPSDKKALHARTGNDLNASGENPVEQNF